MNSTPAPWWWEWSLPFSQPTQIHPLPLQQDFIYLEIMCSDSDELSLLFNPLLEDFLLQGAFDTVRGSTAWQNPTCLFLQGLCLSIHQVCCSHSQDMLLPGMFGRYHSAVSHSERMFLLLSLPTRRRNMRRQPFLLTLLLCFMVMALLSPTKPPACSCYEQGKVQHFYSTCNNVETGI